MATFTLYLPDGLVEDLDAVRGGTSRSKWIRGAVSERLGLPHDELHVPVVRKPPSPSSPRSPVESEVPRGPSEPPRQKSYSELPMRERLAILEAEKGSK